MNFLLADRATWSRNALEVSQLKYSQHPGQRRPPRADRRAAEGDASSRSITILSVGRSVRVEAFVCRKPTRTARRIPVPAAAQPPPVPSRVRCVGDIYLVGRMALSAVGADEVDRVLGQVLR